MNSNFSSLIPYGRQQITAADIQEVVTVLQSDWLTQGPTIRHFEESVAKYCKVPYGISVCNATAALHLACLALGVGKGDRVWTSPNSFVASANCALYCGAEVDFVDIDPLTFNLCPVKLREKLEHAKTRGKLPKVVVAVHFAGLSCEMREIAKLSSEFGFKIIEDASHAIGAKYAGNEVGSCEFSDIAVFSFHPVKIITTAEGGFITTRSEELCNRIRSLRSHGITKVESEFENASQGGWYYEQQVLGMNYRLTDLQAALGISQLQRLDDYVSRRNVIANKYRVALEQLPIKFQEISNKCLSAFHLFVIQLQGEEVGRLRLELYNHLTSKGIQVQVHYIPIHLHPYYERLGFRRGQFLASENYYERALSLPLFPSMNDDELQRVISAMQGFYGC